VLQSHCAFFKFPLLNSIFALFHFSYSMIRSVPFRTGWQIYVALSIRVVSALKATPTSVPLNFLSSVIETWQPRKPVRKDRQWHYRQRSTINLCNNVLLSAPFPTLILKHVLFWDISSVQCNYRRFGTTYRSYLHGSNIQDEQRSDLNFGGSLKSYINISRQ
jgi:hypothetical protein